MASDVVTLQWDFFFFRFDRELNRVYLRDQIRSISSLTSWQHLN